MMLDLGGCCSPAQGETEIQSCPRFVEALVPKWESHNRACQALEQMCNYSNYSNPFAQDQSSNIRNDVEKLQSQNIYADFALGQGHGHDFLVA